MPTYTYLCEYCNESFELFSYIRDYVENPACISCNKKKTHRLLINDVSTLSAAVKKADSELKTIGDLANRNRDKMSQDQKIALEQKHNEYKYDSPKKTLPKGMSRIKKPGHKIKWT